MAGLTSWLPAKKVWFSIATTGWDVHRCYQAAHLTDKRWSTGAAFADYDGDGFVDLMVSRYGRVRSQTISAVRRRRDCRFRGIPVQCGPRGMKGLGDSLYRNNGDGTFTDVSKAAGVDDARGYYGLGVIWSDLNDDGRPDLFVANDSTPNYLYRNDGNGRFTDVSYISGTAVSLDGGEMAGMGVAVCDFNHTGRFSIHVTNFEDQSNSLYAMTEHDVCRGLLCRRDWTRYGAISGMGHRLRRLRQRRVGGFICRQRTCVPTG